MLGQVLCLLPAPREHLMTLSFSDAAMTWRRLPTYFPNFPLKLIPLSEAQQQAYEKTGFLRTLVFRTIPSASKVGALPRVQGRRGRRMCRSLGQSSVILEALWWLVCYSTTESSL